jgi:hypothetical protein
MLDVLKNRYAAWTVEEKPVIHVSEQFRAPHTCWWYNSRLKVVAETCTRPYFAQFHR